jgi:hypothetical protein
MIDVRPLLARMFIRQRRFRRGGRGPHLRRLAWGLAAALLYVGIVAFSRPPAGRILYDGLTPLAPYRWVRPPIDRTGDNQPPSPGSGAAVLGPQGSQATEISTGDEQALITIPAGAFPPHAGESSVKVTITPLDPATIAPVPPGHAFDGNAYRFEATYANSGAPAAITAPLTVVLRYAVHGVVILRAQDRGWRPLQTARFDGSQQMLATTDVLGVFVPLGR